jgi:hypothetical protein
MTPRQRWTTFWSALLGAFDDITTHIGLIVFVIRRLLRHMPWVVGGVGLLAVAGAGLNAAGLLMLLPVLNAVSRGEHVISLFGHALPAAGATLGLLLLLALLLMIGGLYLRFRITHASLQAERRGTELAAALGLQHLRRLGYVPNLAHGVGLVTGRLARAGGFVMRQFSNALATLLQLLIFAGALVWLNPLLSAALLVPGLAVLLWFSASLRNVRDGVSGRAEKHKGLREELALLTELVRTPTVSEQALWDSMVSMQRQGAHGRALSSKLDIKREVRQGPIVVDALFPLALVPLVLVALTSDGWQAHAGLAVVFILLLRSVVATIRALASQLLVLGRFHLEIAAFKELHSGLLPELLLREDAVEDDVDAET